jgi:hypothetical protein
MTFEEFLIYVRKHIGSYCTDEYWKWTYEHLEEHTEEYIKKEMPYLAVNAIGTHYVSQNA